MRQLSDLRTQVRIDGMGLESMYFKADYHYKAKLVNKWIAIIRYSTNEKRVKAYKNLVFKMMKDIVKKNIANYLNLLNNTEVKYMSDRDELVADCYIIFDKCLEKYIIKGNYNFYFYFNKSLSRNFYRDYQKELQRSNGCVEISEALEAVNKGFHDYREPDATELLMEHLGLDELEKRICRSRMLGQKTSEFLKENPDVTNGQYSRCLKKIKEVLIMFQEKGEI